MVFLRYNNTHRNFFQLSSVGDVTRIVRKETAVSMSGLARFLMYRSFAVILWKNSLFSLDSLAHDSSTRNICFAVGEETVSFRSSLKPCIASSIWFDFSFQFLCFYLASLWCSFPSSQKCCSYLLPSYQNVFWRLLWHCPPLVLPYEISLHHLRIIQWYIASHLFVYLPCIYRKDSI